MVSEVPLHLLLQVAGFVGAALVLAVMLDAGGREERVGTGAVTVLVVLAMLGVGTFAWPFVGASLDQRSALAAGNAVAEGASVAGANAGFVEWVRTQVGPGERFWVAPEGPVHATGAYQWLAYRLDRSLSVERPKQADWIIFHGISDTAVDYPRDRFEASRWLSPTYGIARRRDAG